METKVLIFGEEYMNFMFMKDKLVLLKQMLKEQRCLKTIHLLIKVHINTLLNI